MYGWYFWELREKGMDDVRNYGIYIYIYFFYINIFKSFDCEYIYRLYVYVFDYKYEWYYWIIRINWMFGYVEWMK